MSAELVTGGMPRRSLARRRLIVLAGLALFMAVLITGAMWGIKALRDLPPAPSGDPVAIAKFAASARFQQLPPERKAPYIQTLRTSMPQLAAAARAGQITPEERVSAIRNAVRAGARLEMANYFALPPGPARQALLDRLIDEQEQMQKYAAQVGGSVQLDSGVGLKEFLESLPPDERVRMSQLALELFKRRLSRGLPVWPYDSSKR